MAHERELGGVSGWLAIVAVFAVAAASVWGLANTDTDAARALLVFVLVVDGLHLAGLTVVNPNEASVVTLFGVYQGTIKTGLLLVGQPADVTK